MSKKIVAALLTAVMVLGCLTAGAEGVKHERVYVVTGADGSVKSITDNIRLENQDGLEELKDRTMLTGIENLSGEETFTLDQETLVWQAKGKDIVYQGTADKVPAALPRAVLELDGKEISAGEMKNLTGDAVMTVSWQMEEKVPTAALTLMPLPESGISDLKTENATVITAMGRQILVGWAVPGMNRNAGLPASFTASFHADHADLGWMMTVATSDAIDLALRELEARINLDPDEEMKAAETLVTALMTGQKLPESEGTVGMISGKINELNQGLKDLNDGAGTLSEGASALYDGAASVSAGAESLTKGLEQLSGSSEALNQGADALFTGLITTANEQLAEALGTFGMTAPEMTAENYGEILEGLIQKLEPMKALAQEAYAGLTGLKEQLDQVKAFTEGVKAYTAGADQAAAGAKELAAGAEKLSGGALEVRDGAKTLHDQGTDRLEQEVRKTEATLGTGLLVLLKGKGENALKIYEETREHLKNQGYDLRPEDMKTITVYVIRTDLQ